MVKIGCGGLSVVIGGVKLRFQVAVAPWAQALAPVAMPMTSTAWAKGRMRKAALRRREGVVGCLVTGFPLVNINLWGL